MNSAYSARTIKNSTHHVHRNNKLPAVHDDASEDTHKTTTMANSPDTVFKSLSQTISFRQRIGNALEQCLDNHSFIHMDNPSHLTLSICNISESYSLDSQSLHHFLSQQSLLALSIKQWPRNNLPLAVEP
jgi:hypothetical protein